MTLAASYIQHKQNIIDKYLGAEDGIHSLEKIIEARPRLSKAERRIGNYDVYRKPIGPVIYDRFMNPKIKTIIVYLVDNNDSIILYDIY